MEEAARLRLKKHASLVRSRSRWQTAKEVAFFVTLAGVYFLNLNFTDTLFCLVALLILWLMQMQRHIEAAQLRLAMMHVVLDRLGGEDFFDHVENELEASRHL
jgi:hypothetical protein